MIISHSWSIEGDDMSASYSLSQIFIKENKKLKYKETEVQKKPKICLWYFRNSVTIT